jgi:hypothetical protein
MRDDGAAFTPTRIKVQGDHLYWISSSSNGLSRVERSYLDGTNIETILSKVSSLSCIADVSFKTFTSLVF